MRLLLDTHLLLWALGEPARLDRATRAALEDPGNEVLFSAASLWEIAIKAGFGRADFAVEPGLVLEAAVETGFVELPVRASAAVLVSGLPMHHRDPFDRLLIAQAVSEPVHLLTVDPLLVPYSELVRLVR